MTSQMLRALLATAFAVFLASCGGGSPGGTSGGGTPAALSVAAPANVSIRSDEGPQSFGISGGTGPYTATSSATSVVIASAAGKVLTISGISAGSATVEVFDSTGDRVSFSVTVPSGPALFTTAPSPTTIAIGSSVAYSVGGGTSTYVAATSSNFSVAGVALNGSVLTISGFAVGSAQILVFDSSGTSVSTTVAVSPASALSTSAPSAITIAPSSVATYQIIGGVAPYFTASENQTVVTGAVSGVGSLTITAVSSGSATLVVRDSAGASASIAVTVNPVPALFTTATDSVTLAMGEVATYLVGGGTAGYSATSSTAGVATAALAGTALTLTGVTTGTSNVLVRDAAGNTLTVNVIVDPPIPLFSSVLSTITLAPGRTQNYTIGGGQSPYRVASGNEAVVTSTVTGSTLNITGVASGTTSVTVTDALGLTVSTTVTVAPTAAIPLAVTPLAVTASVGETLVFTVSGGDPAYSVQVNNLNIATASASSVAASGGTFSLQLRNTGATTISVIDSRGQTQTVTLTVNSAQPLLRLSPSDVAVSEVFVGNVSFDVFGGTSPYTAFSSDERLASVVASGSRITVNRTSPLLRCIDANTLGYETSTGPSGQFATENSTVRILITVVDSTGRSTTGNLFIVDSVGVCPIP